MKAINGSLLTHIQGETTTLALCAKITRKDGTIIAATAHDRDLVINGITYRADIGSFSASAVSSTADLRVDNLDLSVILDDASVTESDLKNGRYDYAAIEFFLVNWGDLSTGTLPLRIGTLGESSGDGGAWSVEVRGLTQPLQQVIGRTYGKACDADLGDSRCTVNLSAFTVAGTVSSATSQAVFIGSTVPTRTGGKLTWTSGANTGLAMEIKSIAGSTITLVQPMPYVIAASDAYSAAAGCNKQPSICISPFNNIINYQGQPFIPGPDKYNTYPDAP